MPLDRLVLPVCFHINRGNAGFAVIHPVLQQKNVGFLGKLRVVEIKFPRAVESTLCNGWNGNRQRNQQSKQE